MPGKSQYKALPEHREMMLTLKKRGLSDGQIYIQYMRRLVDEKLPIEGAITYESMRSIFVRLRRSKNVQK